MDTPNIPSLNMYTMHILGGIVEATDDVSKDMKLPVLLGRLMGKYELIDTDENMDIVPFMAIVELAVCLLAHIPAVNKKMALEDWLDSNIYDTKEGDKNVN